MLALNLTCMLSFFAWEHTRREKFGWYFCEDDPHCICAKSGMLDPLCAPPMLAEEHCALRNETVMK